MKRARACPVLDTHLDEPGFVRYPIGRMSTSSDIDRTANIASRGRPWWQMCCLGICVIVVAMFVVGSVLFRVVTGPSVQLLSKLPSNYPIAMTPFHLSEAGSISYAPGKSKGTVMQILSAPLRFMANMVGMVSPDKKETSQNLSQALDGYSQQLSSLETVTMKWQPLRASKEEVLSYYTDLFQKNAMTVQQERQDQTNTDLVLATGSGAAIQLEVSDDPSTPDVDRFVMVVDYSAQK